MAGLSQLLEAFETPSAIGAPRAKDPLAAAFEKGRAEGLAEGVMVGRAEGLEEGRQEGRRAGVAEGVEQGRAQGREEATGAHDAVLASLAKNLADALADRAEAEKRLSSAAAAVMRSAVAAALPRLARRGLADEAAATTRDLCARAALGEAALRVAPEHVEVAQAALAAAAETDPHLKTIEVTPDPQASPLTARLEWRDGLAVFDGEEAAARVLARLDAALSGASEECGGASDVAESLL